MKVIDLLNKIANGEEVPDKFMFAGQTFTKKGSYIEDEDGDSILESIFNDFSNINNEVEIIEEDKKIESLINCINGVLNGEMSSYYEKTDLQVIVEHNFKVIQEKINEIIDYINKE